ncbi:hypothetical protein HERIO_2007 [Hepatospora eriocheir]|uniref:Uncharacterized protein n=1 Tax=Hepatospora eriocheir TaxID=1081669 RepID=A0A1X0Q8D3_9MICR|nr:hypothetical protein HERIO_2007 [Hepatospora eriocheir]
MIVNVLRENLYKVKKYKRIITIILLLVSFYFIIPSFNPHKLMSFESCYDLLKVDDTLTQSINTKFEEMLPNDTILIVTNDLEFFDYHISKLKIRTKYIKIVNRDDNKSYFLKIFINRSHTSQVRVNLWSFMVITEVLYVAKAIFNIGFDINPFKITNVWENRIYLNLSYADTRKFLFFLRVMSNFHSHYYGLYFYLPLKDSIIKGDNLGIYCGIMTLVHFFEMNNNINPLSLLMDLIIFKKCPFAFILYYVKNKAAYYSILLMITNLKFAFFYNLGWFCYYVYYHLIEYFNKNF